MSLATVGASLIDCHSSRKQVACFTAIGGGTNGSSHRKLQTYITTGRGRNPFLSFSSLSLVSAAQKAITRSSSSSSSSLKLQSQESMSGTHSSSSSPSIAIIGGGISGLSCALHLQKHHQQKQQQQNSKTKKQQIFPSVTVFDTGRIRPGGRCSSRLPEDNLHKSHKKSNNGNMDSILSRYTIDHAAQMLVLPRKSSSLDPSATSKDEDYFEEFQKQVFEWERDGIVRRFPKHSVVEILSNQSNSSGRTFRIRPVHSENMFYGSQGMGSIPMVMKESHDLHVEQDVWISPSNGVQYVGTPSCPKWSIQSNGKRHGVFDYIVVAHNGKCADRLMSRTPAKDLHSLLRVDFRPNVPEWGGKKMTLNSIYSLTVALQFSEGDETRLSHVVGEDVMIAFVKNEPNLRMITNQSKKFDHLKTVDDGGVGGGGGNQKNKLEVWTIFSSAKFAKQYKAPQENIPQETVDQVTRLMLDSLEKSLGLKEGTLHNGIVKDSRLQLWGAAVPLNVWSAPGPKEDNRDPKSCGFLYDAEHGVGACGDWLLDPSIAGAWESGRRLAHWILDHVGEDEKENGDFSVASVGLPGKGGSFKRIRAACNEGIGNVR